MGPFPLQLAQRYVAPHRVHYRSLSLTIAHYRMCSAAQRSRSGNAPLLCTVDGCVILICSLVQNFEQGSCLNAEKAWSVIQWSFRKVGTMGTLALGRTM